MFSFYIYPTVNKHSYLKNILHVCGAVVSKLWTRYNQCKNANLVIGRLLFYRFYVNDLQYK